MRLAGGECPAIHRPLGDTSTLHRIPECLGDLLIAIRVWFAVVAHTEVAADMLDNARHMASVLLLCPDFGQLLADQSENVIA